MRTGRTHPPLSSLPQEDVATCPPQSTPHQFLQRDTPLPTCRWSRMNWSHGRLNDAVLRIENRGPSISHLAGVGVTEAKKVLLSGPLLGHTQRRTHDAPPSQPLPLTFPLINQGPSQANLMPHPRLFAPSPLSPSHPPPVPDGRWVDEVDKVKEDGVARDDAPPAGREGGRQYTHC